MKKLLRTMLVLVMSFALVAQLPVNVHAEDEEIESASLYCPSTSLVLGNEEKNFTFVYVEVEPEEADYESIDWSLSKNGIVSLEIDDSNGAYLEAIGAGTVTITAKVTGTSGAVFEASRDITVVEPVDEVESISLDETDLVLYEGDEFGGEVSLIVTPTHANYTVKWSSSDTSVAIVDNWHTDDVANIEPVGVGTATVTVTVTDGNGNVQTDTCKVTVKPAPALENFEIDETMSVCVDDYDFIWDYSSPVEANYNVIWSSSDENIVMVDDDGTIYGISVGTAIITAIATDSYGNEFTSTCEVTVKEKTATEYSPIESIEIENMEITVGTYASPSIIVNPKDALYDIDDCSSSDENVATVFWNGQVHGESVGTATITVSFYDYVISDYIEQSFIVTVTSDTSDVCEHNSLVHNSAKSATCTENGHTEFWYCSDCNKYFSDVDAINEINKDDTIIEAFGHSYDEGVITKEATCTEDGIMTYTCSECGDTYTDVIPATGHSYDEGVVTKEASCEEDGVKTYTCSKCGDTKTEVIPATGHSYDEGVITKEATCEEDGVKTYTCSECGDTYTESIPATGHKYDEGVITKDATCTEDGVMTYPCVYCNASYTEVIPAKGHSYDEGVVTKATTCTETGEKTYTCANCGNTYTEEIPATGHSWNDGVVTTEPTDTTEGVLTYTCTICSATKTSTILSNNESALIVLVSNLKTISNDSGKYTSTSYAALLEAIENANAVLSDEDATQEEIFTALSSLEAIYSSLVDVSELSSATTTLTVDDSSKYATDSYNAYVKALEAANTVLSDDNATKGDVASALANLQAAYATLTETTTNDTSDSTKTDDKDTDTTVESQPTQTTDDDTTNTTENNVETETTDVQTSDSSNIALYAGLVLVSLLGAAFFVENKKKFNK